jgi:hypothetical protein
MAYSRARVPEKQQEAHELEKYLRTLTRDGVRGCNNLSQLAQKDASGGNGVTLVAYFIWSKSKGAAHMRRLLVGRDGHAFPEGSVCRQ